MINKDIRTKLASNISINKQLIMITTIKINYININFEKFSQMISVMLRFPNIY